MSQIVLAIRDPVSAATRTFDQNEILVGRADGGLAPMDLALPNRGGAAGATCWSRPAR